MLEKCQKHPRKHHVVAKQVPADHCCVRCDFPTPRLYRLMQANRLQDIGYRETGMNLVAEGRRPLWESDVWWKQCEHCLREVEVHA